MDKFDFNNLPTDDQKTWELISSGRTKGVFQLEKQLGQDWARKLKPANITELGALVALIRPACLNTGIAESYVKRKFGEEEVQKICPIFDEITNDTHGLIVFQEQIIKIGQFCAGMTEEEADSKVRKGIAKKKPELVTEAKKFFNEKAKAFGVLNEDQIEYIIDYMSKAARYSFNKSHGVSYAEEAYICAYIKAHYPLQFYTSWLSYSNYRPKPKQEIYELVQDAKLFNIEILPPKLSTANDNFLIDKNNKDTIIFGLSHIRGIGEKALNKVKGCGGIDNWSDFLINVDKIKRGVAEALIKSGACDEYGLSRIQMIRTLHVIKGYSDKSADTSNKVTRALSPKEQEFFFEDIKKTRDAKASLESILQQEVCQTSRRKIIQDKIKYIQENVKDTNRQNAIWEKIYLGLSLTCSAADDITIRRDNVSDCIDVLDNDKPTGYFNCYLVIDEIVEKRTGAKAKNPGQEYAYITASDNSAAINKLIVWPEQYSESKDDLAEEKVIFVNIQKSLYKNQTQFIAKKIEVIG